MATLLSDLKRRAEVIRALPAMESHTNELDAIIKDISERENRPINILVCGECKRGKSTYINTWLGENICPVDIDVCTAVVTIIKYGERVKAKRYYGSIDNINNYQLSLEEQEISLDSIEEVVASTTISSDTHLVEIELPNDKLKSGITIIDTPGVGGLNPAHGFMTNEFIQRADVVLFAVDTLTPLTETELQFYNQNIYAHNILTIFLLNKCDVIQDYQPMLDDIRQKVSEITCAVPDKITIIPTSVFEGKGLDVIAKSRPLRVLHTALMYKEKIMDLLQKELEQQRLVANADSKNTQTEQQKLTNRIGELNQQIQEWSNPTSAMRIGLQQLFDHRRNDAIAALNMSCTNLIGALLQSKAAEASKQKNGDKWLIGELQAEIDSIEQTLMFDINATIQAITQTDALQKVFTYKAEGLKEGLVLNESIQHNEATFSQQVAPLMQGAGLATMISFWITPWLGIPLGIAMAWSATNGAAANMRIQELVKAASPQLQAISQKLNSYANSTFGDINREIYLAINEILTQLKHQAEKAKDDLRRMSLNATQAAQMKAQSQRNVAVIATQLQMLKPFGGM